MCIRDSYGWLVRLPFCSAPTASGISSSATLPRTATTHICAERRIPQSPPPFRDIAAQYPAVQCITAQAETGLLFDVRQRHHIRSLPAAGRAAAEGPQAPRADTYDFAQTVRWKAIYVFFDESKSHCFRPAKNWVAFFKMSRSSLRMRTSRRSRSFS